MVTFIQATYVVATFVHISNNSAVIDPNLTKLLVPNFLGALIFVDQYSFFDKTAFDPNIFWTKNLCKL